MRWFVLLWVLASSSATYALADDLPRNIKPVLVWTGTDSKQSKESFTRCLSREDWAASWRRHHGKDKDSETPTCPEIDFDSYMVVVIFHGESIQNHGIRVVDFVEEKALSRLRYRPTWYQIGFVLGQGEIDLKRFETRSYAFVVLPRSTKGITLEEDVQNIIGKPPVWKERARFPVAEGK